MTLVENWREIAKKAWSLKFNALALALSAVEAYVSLVKPAGIPNGLFAILAGAITVAAMGARMVAQKELSDGTTK